MKDSTSQKSVGTTSALPSGQEAQTAYVNQRNRLISVASQTREIVTELRKFIREGWAPTHPPLAEGSHAPTESTDVARLLDTRLEKALADIERLIGDTRTKVLVAGDLNTGKSTFINALLHRDVLPVDVLPLTSVFCEVHSATENGGVEEVHVIKLDQEVPYNRANPSTYTKAAISDLEELQGDIDTPPDHALKVYVSHPRPHEKSLLTNGIVDITLIDTPGLNTGLISPTGLFDRQEVDIIVLCLSAEYHLTLSASNFLRAANREKGFI
ncbi:mitofusin, partial [Ceratobasidium sp. 423]